MRALTRLEPQRQIIVGKSVTNALAAERPVPLTAATRTRGEAVAAANAALSEFVSYRPIDVNRATNVVVCGFDEELELTERILRASVIPLGAAQQQTLADARRVRTRVFPQGTDFTRGAMELQWPALLKMQERLQEPEVAAAIDRLGCRSKADHVIAHVDLYGRIIGKNPGGPRAGEEEARADWDEAFRLFVAQVELDYEKDAAMRKELLGAYETQRVQQAALRASGRSRRPGAASKAAGKKVAPQTQPAPAPQATPAPEASSAPASQPAPAPQPAPEPQAAPAHA